MVDFEIHRFIGKTVSWKVKFEGLHGCTDYISPFQAKGSRTANWGILGAKRQAWWDGYPKNHLWCEHPIPHAPRPAKKIPGPFREIWPKTTIPTQQEFDMFGKKSLENTSLPNHTWINDTPQFIHQPQSNWSTMIHSSTHPCDSRLKGHAKKCAPRCWGSIVHQYLFSFLDPVMGGRMPPRHISEAEVKKDGPPPWWFFVQDQVIHHWTHWLVIHFFRFIYSMYILKDLYICPVICIEVAVRKCMMSKGGKIEVTIKGS